MILTAAGLTAIEHIRAGDKVISTDPGTGETAEKTVLKTYLRETDRLVYLTVKGEEIITTVDHPFYVKGRGFVKAGELWAGALLSDVKGNLLRLDDIRQELVEGSVTVYNLQVEEFHTYYAGALSVLVHNANYPEDVNEMQERSQAGQEAEGGAEQRPVEGGSGSVDIDLKYKDGWTAVQKAEADAKVKALSNATTVKTPANRDGTSASSRYKSAYGKTSVPSGYDVDHTIDMQLGGADDILNMNLLDSSVNRSLGVQIKNAIRDYPDGTVFGQFTIH